jgi:glycosyltransferase involved in cell wall biosynthesis
MHRTMGERLRILLSNTNLREQPRGLGFYALQLGAALARRDDTSVAFLAPVEGPPGTEWVRMPRMRHERRLLWEAVHIRRLARKLESDVCHGVYFTVPLFTRMPRVATVHDLIWKHFPENAGWRGGRRQDVMAHIALRAGRIIVPTAHTRRELLKFYSYPEERIRVVAEAPRAGQVPVAADRVEEALARLGVERPYFLCAGVSAVHKRGVDAVRALGALRESGLHAQLVFTGHPGAMRQLLEREARQLGVTDRIRYAGYVDDADLDALYTGSVALLYPSLYEGFGLPPFEAMACGTAVVSTHLPPMDEILEGAAVFVPGRDAAAIAHEAARLLREPGWREECVARGFEHVGRFSWDRAAAETMEVYHEARR